jgi:hypothetical protein
MKVKYKVGATVTYSYAKAAKAARKRAQRKGHSTVFRIRLVSSKTGLRLFRSKALVCKRLKSTGKVSCTRRGKKSH